MDELRAIIFQTQKNRITLHGILPAKLHAFKFDNINFSKKTSSLIFKVWRVFLGCHHAWQKQKISEKGPKYFCFQSVNKCLFSMNIPI